MGEFYKDLAYSLKASEEVFWDAVYRKAFPNLIRTEIVNDMSRQKDGIDRAIYLATVAGTQNVLWVDEKKRGKVYSDILLEHTSNVERGTPGWIEKDLAIDYIAYAFMPIKRAYLFPWPMLRRAWINFSGEWRKRYPDTIPGYTPIGNGRQYTTHSVAVPISVLQTAVTTSAIIDVSDHF